MVEIPRFYYKYSYIGNTHNWSISSTLLEGYEIHPAFNKGGVEVEHRYIGAYNASTDGSVLKSVSGEYCNGYMTRAILRTRANNINPGAGWSILDFNLLSAIQLLMLIEFGTFYTQSAIGMGRTELYTGSWGNGDFFGLNGLSNSIGNATGNVSYSGDANDAGAELAYMSYRGIENFYGNVWKYIDGINIKDYVPYICNNPTLFADDTFTGSYISALPDGITMANSNGSQNTLAQVETGFFPVSVNNGASSSTKITDYYYQSPGESYLQTGGDANHNSLAGAFATYMSTGTYYNVGSILAF
jgi:hypothetical protein